MYFSSEVYNNKLVLHSELMVFIRYKDNNYHFICYIQENIIFHFIHAIFNKEFFSKYINSYMNEYKLYNKLLDKISSETKSSVFESFSKDKPISIPISHIFTSLI